MSVLAQQVVEAGGSLHPLIIPAELTNGTGLMNPSVFVDGDRLLVNVRHVNYTLYHSENKRFQHRYGPLQYLHPENDRKLRTWNYFCELNQDLTIKSYHLIDTSTHDVTPIWEFVGLEDGRLVRWNGDLFLTGVRRDTTTNGVGRMELSLLEETGDSVREVNRTRMPAPLPNTSYCEKNWMPVIDKPFTFVKWSNPTEVVVYNRNTNETITKHLRKESFVSGLPDFRGGSQVIPWGDYYIAIIHEVDLFKPKVGNKDASYYHRFLVWDREWNLVHWSDSWSFMGAEIEFCCGAAFYDGALLISFGYQDNAAYILRIPEDKLESIVGFTCK